MLTFEGTQIQGTAAVIEKLAVSISMPSLKSSVARTDLTLTPLAVQSLPFQKVQHKVTTRDAQPSSPTVASLIVNVTGVLVVSRTGPLLVVTPSSSHHPPGRRQSEPTAVLPGVPSYPGWRELLRVRSALSHHHKMLIESTLSFVFAVSLNDIFRLNYGA